MTFVFIVALTEFALAVIFYVQLRKEKRLTRELSGDLVRTGETIADLEQLLDDSGERDAEHSRRVDETLSTILNNTELLMSSFDDLKAAQADTDAKVAAVKTDVEALIAKLAAVPAAGMTAEQQAALDDAVTHAKSINDSLSAVNAEVNPAPAPAPADVPAAPAQ